MAAKKIQFAARELQVVTLICREQTTQEIVVAIGISVRAVEDYRHRILVKTGSRICWYCCIRDKEQAYQIAGSF